MARLMSVALTEAAVVARHKVETRRLGWTMVHVGDELRLVRKAMGRSRVINGRRVTEPLVDVARVQVIETRREPLNHITDVAVDREGFGPYGDPWPYQDWWPPGTVPPADHHGLASERFVEFFTHHMRCAPDREVTVIGWEYL